MADKSDGPYLQLWTVNNENKNGEVDRWVRQTFRLWLGNIQ